MKEEGLYIAVTTSSFMRYPPRRTYIWRRKIFDITKHFAASYLLCDQKCMEGTAKGRQLENALGKIFPGDFYRADCRDNVGGCSKRTTSFDSLVDYGIPFVHAIYILMHLHF
jgi:hypothetical protein